MLSLYRSGHMSLGALSFFHLSNQKEVELPFLIVLEIQEQNEGSKVLTPGQIIVF